MSRPMANPMTRTLLWALAGVLLGGIIHILAVMYVPDNTDDDAWTRAADFGADARFTMLPPVRPGAEPLPMLDPAMAHALCRFTLEDGPVRLDARIPGTFWSFSLFNRRGETTYSFNDRTSGEGRLAMLVLTPAQLSILRESPPPDLESLIVIETDDDHAMALLRAHVTSDADRTRIRQALDKATCAQDTLTGAI